MLEVEFRIRSHAGHYNFKYIFCAECAASGNTKLQPKKISVRITRTSDTIKRSFHNIVFLWNTKFTPRGICHNENTTRSSNTC